MGGPQYSGLDVDREAVFGSGARLPKETGDRMRCRKCATVVPTYSGILVT